jgi:large subunit ribosomal protein L2
MLRRGLDGRRAWRRPLANCASGLRAHPPSLACHMSVCLTNFTRAVSSGAGSRSSAERGLASVSVATDIFNADFEWAPERAATHRQTDTLKYHRGLTNGQRGKVSLDFKKAGLWRGRPFKPLTAPKKRTGGRSNGRITCRHRGGGAKRRLRIIDFRRQLWDVAATVQRLEYDPNRSAFIALLEYENGVMSYILAPQGLRAGDTVIAGKGADGKGIDPKPGNAAPLKFLPVGVRVHNIETSPGSGGALVRSAGASAVYQARTEDGFAVLRMPSKERRMVPIMCMASVGQVSNPLHSMQKLGKAGASRHRGIRPTVRGVAMNPVDHPLGGGEGKTSGGRPAVSPWGFPCKGGYRTRKRRKPSRKLIISDRRGMALPKTLAERKRFRRNRRAKA